MELLHYVFSLFDDMVDKEKVYKVEAIDNVYMCTAGCPKVSLPFRARFALAPNRAGEERLKNAWLKTTRSTLAPLSHCSPAPPNAPNAPPQSDPDHAVHIASMAIAMNYLVQQRLFKLKSGKSISIDLKIGLHTGPVVGGVVGKKSYSYHLFGDAVNTCSRMCSSGRLGMVQMSAIFEETLKQQGMHKLVKMQFPSVECVSRGVIRVKGKGEMATFWLVFTTRADTSDAALSPSEAQEKIYTSALSSHFLEIADDDVATSSFRSALDDISCDFFTLGFVANPPRIATFRAVSGSGRRGSWDAALDAAGLRRRSLVRTPDQSIMNSMDMAAPRRTSAVPGETLNTTGAANSIQRAGVAVLKAVGRHKRNLSGGSGGSGGSASEEFDSDSGEESSERVFSSLKSRTMAVSLAPGGGLTRGNSLAKGMETKFSIFYNQGNLKHLQQIFILLSVLTWMMAFGATVFMSNRATGTKYVFFVPALVCTGFAVFAFKSSHHVSTYT